MFSVIIPVHNKLPYLERSVNSVLNQSFKEFEILLIDDASTDGSTEKLKEINDPRIRLFRRESSGPGGYAARNLGIENAKYDWICFLDADDEWKENYLSEIKKVISKYPKSKIITAEWEIVKGVKNTSTSKKQSEKQSEYRHFNLISYLKNSNLMWTGVVNVHRDIIEQAKGFPEDNHCKRGGDVDTWIRWLDASPLNINIQNKLSFYYKDIEGQVTSVPNTYFCAYDTLMKMYVRSKDKDYRTAIENFVNKFLYGMLFRQIKSGASIDYNTIKKMFFNRYAIIRILKLHFIRLSKMISNL